MRVYTDDRRAVEAAWANDGERLSALDLVAQQKQRRRQRSFAGSMRWIASRLARRLKQGERRKDNLLILWADEAQNSVTAAEDGLSDYNCVDKIREAGGTVVAATQSTTSFIPPLGKDKAKVFTLNLSNQLIFLSADEEDAKDAADFIGQREVVKKSWGTSGGRTSYNYNKVDQHQVKPHRLRKLRNHQCYLVHCNGQFKKVYLEPIEPDGRISPWFPNSPAARLWRWLRAA